MVKILAFDTETNVSMNDNLIKDKNKNKDEYIKILLDNIDSLPSIIQLAYIVYDTVDPLNTKFFNKYIIIPTTIKITKETTKIHHITNKKIQQLHPKNKLTINNAIHKFMDDVSKADIIIGHNVNFDRQMIITEILRLSTNTCDDNLKQQWIKQMMNDNIFLCTMKLTKTKCNIKMQTKKINRTTGKTKVFDKIKSPKLIEAYNHFFGYTPANKLLHNAIIDSIICLRVYCMCLKNKLDVYGTNSELTKYINSFSPKGYKEHYKQRQTQTRKLTK